MQQPPLPPQLVLMPTSGADRSAVKSLPRFDPYVMETYLDDQRDMKAKVHDLFRQHPELLPAVEEGLSKGGGLPEPCWSSSVLRRTAARLVCRPCTA